MLIYKIVLVSQSLSAHCFTSVASASVYYFFIKYKSIKTIPKNRGENTDQGQNFRAHNKLKYRLFIVSLENIYYGGARRR